MTSLSPLAAATPAFSFRRDALPHLLAVGALLLLVVLYFSPIFFDHKTLVQNDILQFQGGAREIVAWEKQTGHAPLWTNTMFGGMPSYLILTRYPGDFSQYLTTLFTLGLPTAASNIFCALLCGYILFVSLGLRWWLAIGGAVALGFSSYNLIILEAGHNTKSFAIAYAPLVIGGVLLAFRRNRWLGAALLALGLTLNVRSNHLQISFYLALLLGIFVVIELVGAVREKRLSAFLQTSALLGVAALVAVGVSFGRLYTMASYSKASIRGKSELTTPAPTANGKAPAGAADQAAGSGLDRDYAFGWSYGVGETITLLVPDFYGGASTHALSKTSATAQLVGAEQAESMPVYWGEQPFTSGPVYVGAVVCFLFVLGLFVVERRIALWLLLASVLGIVLAWGKNFEVLNYFLFDYLPGYNKFRAVAMALVIPQLAMPVLGLLAAWRLLAPRGQAAATPARLPHEPAPAEPTFGGLLPAAGRMQALLRATYVMGGLLGLAFLAALLADTSGAADASILNQGQDPSQRQQMQQIVNALRDDRGALARADVLRSLFYVLAAAGVLWAMLKSKLSASAAGLALSALLLADLWLVDTRYVNTTDFKANVVQEHFQPSPADAQIQQDKDYFRVLNMQNPFNDARTSYFHFSIGGYHGAKLRRFQDVVERQLSGPNFPKIIGMLNARYVIQNPNQPAQRNPSALGNAWLVREVKTVQTPDQELAALTDLDPATTAVVDATKFPAVKAGALDPGAGAISLTKYEPEKLTYAANLTAPATAVFSEIYYADGWNAYLDGKAAPYFRANYLLRAMSLPAGQHTVEFRFEPTEYTIGNTVSLISSILLVLLVGGAGWLGWRQRTAGAVAPIG
ncbi:MAG: YfhO family protein [Hymenobacteraceae bacterium]|nr:YfhO family protein [Hymenobacteraceae bacterium]